MVRSYDHYVPREYEGFQRFWQQENLYKTLINLYLFYLFVSCLFPTFSCFLHPQTTRPPLTTHGS